MLILDNPQADGSDMLHWHTVKYSHWQLLAHSPSICISVAGSGCRMDYNDDELVYSVSGGDDRSISEAGTAFPVGDVVTAIMW